MLEIGDDLFLALLEFAAECLVPLHRIDFETVVFVEDDVLWDRSDIDEQDHGESETIHKQ